MKDRQSASAGALARIPILSPVLHWMALPVIVLLRSGFGFSFLGSKAVFLSCVWAAGLLFIYARIEPGAWTKWWAFASFGIAASVFYITHLLIAFSREKNRRAKHDYDAGTPHLLKLLGGANLHSPRLELAVHLWLEPAATVFAALVLRGVFSERILSGWLVLVAASLWLKAFINWWYGIRSEKKHSDIMEDAGEKVAESAGGVSVPLPNADGRKERVRKPRTEKPPPVSPGKEETEWRFAQVLRLMPPYDLQQAERNFAALINNCRPGCSSETPIEPQSANELVEAIEYFRSR